MLFRTCLESLWNQHRLSPCIACIRCLSCLSVYPSVRRTKFSPLRFSDFFINCERHLYLVDIKPSVAGVAAKFWVVKGQIWPSSYDPLPQLSMPCKQSRHTIVQGFCFLHWTLRISMRHLHLNATTTLGDNLRVLSGFRSLWILEAWVYSQARNNLSLTECGSEFCYEFVKHSIVLFWPPPICQQSRVLFRRFFEDNFSSLFPRT